MAESANATTVPIAASIEDANGAIWTIRLTDRAVLKDSVSTGISNVMQIWYLNQIVWAFKGTRWRYWDNATVRWKRDPNGDPKFQTLPPSTFPTTAGLRLTTGPTSLASHAGVQISAGANIQAAVDANPAGTTYVLAVGTYTSQTVQLKSNDQIVGLHNGTSGAVMNGASNTQYAFGGTGHHVTIRNIFIQNYTAPTQHGAIENTLGPWWIIQSCSITGGTLGGSVNVCDYALVIACKLNDNAQQGYSVHGDDVQADGNRRPYVGVLFDSNEISGNNPTEAQWGGSEQGGGKALNTQYLTFWFNDSNDNGGSNYWTDYNNWATLYWGNKGGPGGWNGIEHEISYNAKFLHNNFTDIGAGSEAATFYGGCIFIGNSGGVSDGRYEGEIEIAYNTMEPGTFGRALSMRQQSRSVDDYYNVGTEHRWIYKMRVHHNTIDWSNSTVVSGMFGLMTDTGSDLVFWGADRVSFDYNTYEAGANFDQFVWNGSYNLDWNVWQSFGNDPHGTYNSNAVPIGWSTGAHNGNITISGATNRVATGGGVAATDYIGRGSSTTAIRTGQKKMFVIKITNGGSGLAGVGIVDSFVGMGDNSYLGQSTNYNSYGYFDNGGIYLAGSGSGGMPTYADNDDIVICVEGGNKWWANVNAVPNITTGGFNIQWLVTVFPAYDVKLGGVVTLDPTAAGYTPPAGYTTLA